MSKEIVTVLSPDEICHIVARHVMAERRPKFVGGVIPELQTMYTSQEGKPIKIDQYRMIIKLPE